MANDYNYFTQNIQRMGEEFLMLKNSKDFQREAPNIFRQLARRQIDLEMYGHFFLEKQFLESCINVANEQILMNKAISIGLGYYVDSMTYMNGGVDPYFLTILKMYRDKCEAYTIIHQHLCLLRDSGNINYIKSLASVLTTNRTLGNAL